MNLSMLTTLAQTAVSPVTFVYWALAIVVAIFVIILLFVFLNFGNLWVQA